MTWLSLLFILYYSSFWTEMFRNERDLSRQTLQQSHRKTHCLTTVPKEAAHSPSEWGRCPNDHQQSKGKSKSKGQWSLRDNTNHSWKRDKLIWLFPHSRNGQIRSICGGTWMTRCASHHTVSRFRQEDTATGCRTWYLFFFPASHFPRKWPHFIT